MIYLDGIDLTHVELFDRKEALRQRIGGGRDGSIVQYSEHVEGNGQEFYSFSCESGLEGVICKRRTSPYRQRRSKDWRKLKCSTRQKFVVGGFTEPSGHRRGFGALLLGTPENDQQAQTISITDLPGLTSLVQLGRLEFHPWGSRSSDPESPDRLILDLDPSPGIDWPTVVAAARDLRDVLLGLGLTSYVRLALKRRRRWE